MAERGFSEKLYFVLNTNDNLLAVLLRRIGYSLCLAFCRPDFLCMTYLISNFSGFFISYLHKSRLWADTIISPLFGDVGKVIQVSSV